MRVLREVTRQPRCGLCDKTVKMWTDQKGRGAFEKTQRTVLRQKTEGGMSHQQGREKHTTRKMEEVSSESRKGNQ